MARIVLDGVERDVRVERGPAGMTVFVDGRPYRVSDVVHLAGAVGFFAGNASHVAYVSGGPGGTSLSLHGNTYHRSDVRRDADAPSLSDGGRRDGRVQAPMPGSIIALHVKPGDAVRAGQPVVVLESMKMHNELAAPIDGVVRLVNCGVGDQVAFGQVLAEIGVE